MLLPWCRGRACQVVPCLTLDKEEMSWRLIKLTSCQSSCSSPGWSWQWRRPGWGLISCPSLPTEYAGFKVTLNWVTLLLVLFCYRKFTLPPLLGPGLNEKTQACSPRPKQLPTFGARSSSSHLLPAIGSSTGVFFYKIGFDKLPRCSHFTCAERSSWKLVPGKQQPRRSAAT